MSVSNLRDQDVTDTKCSRGWRRLGVCNGLWREKEYVKVVELLSPLQEWLSPSEVKKLEYARRVENGSATQTNIFSHFSDRANRQWL